MPKVVRNAIHKIRSFAKLKEKNIFGGLRPDEESMKTAIDLLEMIQRDPQSVEPMDNGGIIIEWQYNTGFIEVSILYDEVEVLIIEPGPIYRKGTIEDVLKLKGDLNEEDVGKRIRKVRKIK